MTTAHYLTDTEVDLLQRVLDTHRGRRVNQPVSRRDTLWEEHEGQQAPEVYIAIPVESAGIEGLTPAVFGANQEDDEVGAGVCDIYRIVDARLVWVEKTEYVFNCSEARIRDEWFTVQRTKFGQWVVVNHFVVLDALLAEELTAAEGPLTGATVSRAHLIEWLENVAVEDGEPYAAANWRIITKSVRVINRSVNFRGSVGTYGVFGKLGGEFRPIALDCDPSEEGVHAVITLTGDFGDSTGSGSLGGGVTGG